MKIIKNYQGFSLVEAIIYLAIVGVLLTAVVNFHLTLGNTSEKLSSSILTAKDRRIALETIDYLASNSDGLLKDVYGDCSDLSASPPVLSLYFEDDTYLPGNCVENGGGVEISLEDRRLVMTCYPNMLGNGYYQNCDESVYKARNKYYLTSAETSILDSYLNFSTSTATSTANQFTTLTSNISVSTALNNQVLRAATSTATSTVVLKNEHDSGLVAFYKFDDAAGSSAVDSAGNNDLTCTGTPTAQNTALISGSTYSFDFNQSEGDYCYIDNPDVFNFSTAFTVSAWVKMHYTTDFQSGLFSKVDWGTSKGYLLMIYYTGGRVIFRICDSTACSNTVDQSALIADATVYNITSVYDLDNDRATLYVYQDGVGSVNTTTVSSIPTLVNYEASNYPRIGTSFDGAIDDMRIYNRALTAAEVAAIQSQGY